MLGHVTIHFGRIFLLHLQVQVFFITPNLVILDRLDTLIDKSVLGKLPRHHCFLELSVGHLIIVLLPLVVIHLLEEKVLIL